MTTAVETTTETVAGKDVEAVTAEELDPGWAHERIEYKGDNLAVRAAQMQALMAYQLSSGKFIPMEKQNDASGLFIDQHFGPDSYDRIVQRMMNPEDTDYTMKSFAEIVGLLVKMSVAKIKEAREAEEAAKAAKEIPATA